jgi:hypothetical protein
MPLIGKDFLSQSLPAPCRKDFPSDKSFLHGAARFFCLSKAPRMMQRGFARLRKLPAKCSEVLHVLRKLPAKCSEVLHAYQSFLQSAAGFFHLSKASCQYFFVIQNVNPRHPERQRRIYVLSTTDSSVASLPLNDEVIVASLPDPADGRSE